MIKFLISDFITNAARIIKYLLTPYVVVQSLSCVWVVATPWTAACQASLSFTVSWCLLKFMATELVAISSSATLFFCLQSFPASGSFPMSWVFTSGGQNIGVSASASVLPGNIQGWFPLGLTSSISSKPKGLSRVFSSTTIWKHQFFGAQPSSWSNSPIYTWLLEKPQLWLCKLLLAKCCLCFLICFVIAFLPRSKRLLISWLQSPSAVIL